MPDPGNSTCDLIPLVQYSFIFRYVFPVQFCVGFVGNWMILLVLNSRALRSKTHILLSCMSFCDLCFLIALLPKSLAAYPMFAFNNQFRLFYYAVKVPMTQFLSNWFSAASIWFAVAVTIERITVIRFPLKSHIPWQTSRLVGLIVLVCMFTFGLTFYNNVWTKPQPYPGCENHTVSSYRFVDVLSANDTSAFLRNYIKISINLGVAVIVIGPLTALIILNSILIYFLHNSTKSMKNVEHTHSLQTRQNERRLTITVAVIIKSFILFNCPSAVIHLMQIPQWHEAVEISNALVVTGKVVNFILYCVASRNFRKQLANTAACQRAKKFQYEISTSLRRRSTDSPAKNGTILCEFPPLNPNNQQRLRSRTQSVLTKQSTDESKELIIIDTNGTL